MKLYLKLITLLVFIVLSAGAIIPFLISYKSTFVVMIGFGYILIILPTIIFYLIKSIRKDLKHNFNPGEDNE